MEPSWSLPIPQAMQQHRGLQCAKAAPAKSAAPVAPAAIASEAAQTERSERMAEPPS